MRRAIVSPWMGRTVGVAVMVLVGLGVLAGSARAQNPAPNLNQANSDINRGGFGELELRWEVGEVTATTSPTTSYEIQYEGRGTGGSPQPAHSVLLNRLAPIVTLQEDDPGITKLDRNRGFTLSNEFLRRAGMPPIEHNTWYKVGLRPIAGTNKGASQIELGGATVKTGNPSTPNAVTRLQLTAGDGQITATWRKSEAPMDTHLPIAGYDVSWTGTGTAGSSTSTTTGQTQVTDTMITIMDLMNGVEYTVTVKAFDERESPMSTEVSGVATPMAGDTDDGDMTETPALPLFGILALFAGLLAAGRARLRR